MHTTNTNNSVVIDGKGAWEFGGGGKGDKWGQKEALLGAVCT